MSSLDQFTKTANVGLTFICQNTNASLMAKRRLEQTAQTGFIAPATIYEKMRSIHADAERLNQNINAYVSDPVFRNSFLAWLSNWVPFYEKYAGPTPDTSAKLAAAFRSEELNQQVEDERARLQSFYEQYQSQKRPDGSPVPGLPAPNVRPPSPLPPPPVSSTPWWFWVAGGALLVGVGYLVFKKVKAGESRDVDYPDQRRNITLSRDYPPGALHSSHSLPPSISDDEEERPFAPFVLGYYAEQAEAVAVAADPNIRFSGSPSHHYVNRDPGYYPVVTNHPRAHNPVIVGYRRGDL